MMIPHSDEQVDATLIQIIEDDLDAESLLGIGGIREILLDEYEHEINSILAQAEEMNNASTRSLVYGP